MISSVSSIKKNFDRAEKVFREKGFLGFFRRVLEKLFNPFKPLFFFLFSTILSAKLKKIKTKDRERLFDFASRTLFGIIKPLQVQEEILQMIEVVVDKKPKVILEIGTSFGGVLFLLAKAAPEDAVIVSVDLPGKKGGYPEWRKNLYKGFVSKNQNLYLLKEDSRESSTLFMVQKILGSRKVDFLFIDGDHTYNGVKHDFMTYKVLMNNRGILAFHDIVRHPADSGCEVERFWNEIKEDYEYSEIIKNRNQGWGGIGLLYLE